jgi:hypothetical protein
MDDEMTIQKVLATPDVATDSGGGRRVLLNPHPAHGIPAVVFAERTVTDRPLRLSSGALPTRISRRQAIASAIAAFATIASPLRVTAEPATAAAVIAVVAAVVGIVSGLAGMLSDAKLRKGIDSILEQLSLVIAYQQLILQELRAMRLYFDEALLASWQGAYARSIAAYDAELFRLRKGLLDSDWKVDNRLRDDLESLSRDCFHTTMEIGQMNVWAFPSFASGVAVVLLADTILKTKPHLTSGTKTKFRERIDVWLDPKALHSLPQLIAATTKDVEELTQALAARDRSYVTRNEVVHWAVPGETCSRRDVDTVSIAGSLEAGFTGTVATSVSESRCRDIGRAGGGRRPLSVYSGNLDPRLAASMGMFSEAGTTSEAIPVVPAFNPSGFAIVDTFNQERIAVYEMQAALARQKVLLSYMEQMRQALT